VLTGNTPSIHMPADIGEMRHVALDGPREREAGVMGQRMLAAIGVQGVIKAGEIAARQDFQRVQHNLSPPYRGRREARMGTADIGDQKPQDLWIFFVLVHGRAHGKSNAHRRKLDRTEMNYRHAYHAGNFADVLKHAALMAVLVYLKKKETPFAVIDTHAGRGLYDMASGEAAKTLEAKDGIAKLLEGGTPPGILEPYVRLMREYAPKNYPGSPLIAARLMRKQDRLVAIEKHPEEYDLLRPVLHQYLRARAVSGDGYRELAQLVPPPERRGIVLIDPPYEATDEFETSVAALIDAHRKFATGIFLLWYPAKARGAIQGAVGELLHAGISRLLRVELDIGRKPEDEGRALSAAGLLVVNPPFGFAREMELVTRYLAKALARGRGAKAEVERLAGEE
jgi:23S rRNA (adenine2030-N6)-methyltransferase